MKSLIAVQNEKAKARDLAAKANLPFEVNGKTHIENGVLYCRKAMNGLAGIQQLIKPQDPEKDGVRNIDSAKLVTGEAFIVTGILLSFATNTAKATGEDDLFKVSYSPAASGLGTNKALLNSELTVKIQNKEKFKGVLSHMCGDPESHDNKADVTYQVSPFVIAPNQTITPELNIFHNPIAVDKDAFIEVALVGYKVSQNNA